MHGSVLKGALLSSLFGSRAPDSVTGPTKQLQQDKQTFSFKNGLQTLVDALETDCKKQGRLISVAAKQLRYFEHKEKPFEILLSNNTTIQAHRVVAALPAYATAGTSMG
jgi:protoporphyrinogen oxidase